MSRQFEKEYIETNDRIHPRKDLLAEMEQRWAVEEAKEQRKAAVFPAWARFAAAAAGILLCVGVGMGSVLLYSRSRGMKNKTASAQRTEITAAGAADMAAEPQEEKILFEAAEAEEAMDAEAEAPMTMLAAAAPEAPQGTHFALNEAEVEDNLRYGSADMGKVKAAGAANSVETETETACPAGKVIRRDDTFAVFLPTLEQVHVIECANNKVNSLFALTLREKGTEVRDIFWLGSELLAIRQQAGETELLRFDVADWKAPRHLLNLTQSGELLGAWQMGERLYILSRCTAAEEEPLPWVNGARLDFDRVLLDGDRPGDTFALLTVYQPGLGEGFGSAIALLSPIQGAAQMGNDRLLLWTQGPETDLYVLSLGAHGLVLTAESQMTGAVRCAGPLGEGFGLLMEDGAKAALVKLNADLIETARTAAKTDDVRWGQVYEAGAVILTGSDTHFLTDSGDHALPVTGDAFCRLTPNRGLILSADGQLQLVALGENGLEALGTAQVKGGLGSLLEDLSRLAFDGDTGRLVIPAGQNVYQYILDEAGKLTLRGETQSFRDHDETEQRELRAMLIEDKTLVFYKFGVFLCNQNLSRQMTCKY